MAKNTFILSDESLNSYGYIVKTNGINTVAFCKNPIMLYMHERKTVVGRWENIRIDGEKLLADAVFDASTDLGRVVKSQVEKGFLRCASIGVDIIEEREINGVKTITKSELFEASIVDIPANKNALKLYKKGGSKRLSLEVDGGVNDLRKEIINALDLSDDVSDMVIIEEIKKLISSKDDAFVDVENAVNGGFIENENRDHFLTMARVSPIAFKSFISGEKEKRKKAISAAVDAAFAERRINYMQKDLFNCIGDKIGVEMLSKLLGCMRQEKKLSEVLSKDKKGWSLLDYRRFAPEELKNNPELYEELIKKDKIESGEVHTLDYFRKHNPQYLKEHPEEYKRLLENI